MNEIVQKNSDFLNIYNRSYRLAAAVFVISNLMDQNDELRTKIKKLSLDLVSMSVNLKDTSFPNTKKLMIDIEKNSLELMSMLDIASISGLVSKMNGDVLKEEFQSFILEINKFSERLEGDKNVSLDGIFKESLVTNINNNLEKTNLRYYDETGEIYKSEQKVVSNNGLKNGNGHKRKDLRKNTILNFIKGHNNVNIKDIVPNITGCSEKTVQRELIQLVSEGKIIKIGERRWSRYSI